MGNDGIVNTDNPVHVVAEEDSSDHLGGVIQIATGGTHSCALNSDGEVLCWGAGVDGQLGNDGIVNTDYPVYVVDGDSSTIRLGGVIQIVTGATHTCALNSDGEILCWGDGEHGRLGNDAEDNTDHPVNVVAGNASSVALNVGNVFQRSYTCRGSNGSCAHNVALAISEDSPAEVKVSGTGAG